MSKVSIVTTGAVALASVAAYAWYQSKKPKAVTIVMPDWLYKYEASLSAAEFPTDEAMMVVAVEISAQNVSRGTGGPFGCAIFQRDVNTKVCKLFSVGANRVVPLTNSTVHGEMAAIQFAEMKLKAFSLRKAEGDVYEYILCTSCEPCAMCLGGTFWAAPAEMICAATKDDAEAIGFDEGPVYPKSYVDLEKAGVKVKKAVLRAEGNKVLQDYAKLGVIYQG